MEELSQRSLNILNAGIDGGEKVGESSAAGTHLWGLARLRGFEPMEAFLYLSSSVILLNAQFYAPHGDCWWEMGEPGIALARYHVQDAWVCTVREQHAP